MKKLSILLAAMLLLNSIPSFAAGDETEIYDEVQLISAPVTVQPEVIHNIPVLVNCVPTNFTNKAMLVNNVILVPFQEMTQALGLAYEYSSGIYKAFSPTVSLAVDSLNNAYISNALQIPDAVPSTINGTLYVPATLFVNAFNLDKIILADNETPILFLAPKTAVAPVAEVTPPVQETTPVQEAAPIDNSYVNTSGLASDTPYLIWVSKSEYKLRVYLGEKGRWTQINEFPCAIGKDSTPTCEGTYKYYQAQKMWDYGSYYVGPIMRFNGGFAIHSTLIYKNGTPKDDRVGMKLSLGCVRLHPADINWLSYYAPLGTTIHITG